MTRAAGWIAAGFLAVLLVSSCALPANPPNPFQNLRTFAVLPLVNLTDQVSLDIPNLTQIFYSEFGKFEGFELTTPSIVQKTIVQEGIRISGPDDIIRLGRILGVDAVATAGITDYHPYHPPRLGVALQIFPTKSGARALDISAMAQSGKPFPLSEDHKKRPVSEVIVLYDAGEKEVAGNIRRYARRHTVERRAFGSDVYFRVMDEYARFCFNQILREMIARETKRQETEKKKPAGQSQEKSDM